MDDVIVLRQACSMFRILFLKLVKMDPFRQSITIWSICNKVFRTMFLKPDTVCIIQRAWNRMGDRQSVEALQWVAYVGQTRYNITHAGNVREVHLPGVPNVKVDGYCAETRKVFENLGCIWHGCLCMPNRHKPINKTDETLLSRYVDTSEVAENKRRRLYSCFDLGVRV